MASGAEWYQPVSFFFSSFWVLGFPKTDYVWDTGYENRGDGYRITLEKLRVIVWASDLMTFVDLSEHLLPFFWMVVLLFTACFYFSLLRLLDMSQALFGWSMFSFHRHFILYGRIFLSVHFQLSLWQREVFKRNPYTLFITLFPSFVLFLFSFPLSLWICVLPCVIRYSDHVFRLAG